MISLLHATWGRPQKALAAMRDALANASDPAHVEYIFAAEVDDAPTVNALLDCGAMIVTGPFNGSAPAWDAAARVCKGDLLVQMQDDLELPVQWDKTLLRAYFTDVGPYHAARPAVIRVSDGHRRDSLICTAIINRARYEQVGEFIHAGYKSVYSDGEFTLRAMLDARAGKCHLIDARDIVFLHRHHYHDKTVPMDATYARENSNAAYGQGLRLFMQRNPGWGKCGLVDWM